MFSLAAFTSIYLWTKRSLRNITLTNSWKNNLWKKKKKKNPINEFLDSLPWNIFLPYILLPTRISSNSNTLIDNILSNFISNEVIDVNLSATISDHLPQFLIAPAIFCNPPANKTNIFERNWSKFNHENFILDYFDINWPNVLKVDMQNVDLSFNNFYEAINAVLDKHAPYQKVKKYISK